MIPNDQFTHTVEGAAAYERYRASMEDIEDPTEGWGEGEYHPEDEEDEEEHDDGCYGCYYGCRDCS